MVLEGIAIADIVNGLIDACGFALSKLRCPLRVEVTSLCFGDTRKAHDPTIVTSCPRRYLVDLDIANRSSKVVYIRTITLALAQNGRAKKAAANAWLSLAPGELKHHRVAFPVDEGEEPVGTGSFRIDVVPTVGRKTVVTGQLPRL